MLCERIVAYYNADVVPDKPAQNQESAMLAKPLVDGLYAIPISIVNTFLIDSPDGCILVDSGVPGSADKILQAIHELGKQDSDIRHIFLTHAHSDHIGSFAALKQATGAEVYIHPLDAPIATSGTGFRPLKPSPSLISRLLIRIFVGSMDESRTEGAPIEHQVEDGEMLPGGLKAIHIPGHTAGQLAFLWPQSGGVLFAADACSNIMRLGWSLGYEDLEEGKRSLNKLAQLDFQIACFGHGKATLQDASARFRTKWG
jgi:glyoxylase-like metal-dependent hydrolase (beta-lactamase superfamily II)